VFSVDGTLDSKLITSLILAHLFNRHKAARRTVATPAWHSRNVVTIDDGAEVSLLLRAGGALCKGITTTWLNHSSRPNSLAARTNFINIR
jgi:hypothetical protein